ncbi:MAG: hypothetical protein JO100_13830 [Pseudonocardia sp.]|nr:hypothetical protein [Pseudonocardia sp.]
MRHTTPYAEYPLTVCGIHILPEIYLPGPVTLCPRCLAGTPDRAALRPGAGERRVLGEPDASRLTGFWRWWLSRWYDRRIRRALAEEARRHG